MFANFMADKNDVSTVVTIAVPVQLSSGILIGPRGRIESVEPADRLMTPGLRPDRTRKAPIVAAAIRVVGNSASVARSW